MSENFDEFLSRIKVSPYDPGFYQKVHTYVARNRKASSVYDSHGIGKICEEEYDDLSRRLDLSGLQMSVSVRNVLKTRQIATLLFTDKGELNVHLLPLFIEQFKKSLYYLGPDRQDDSVRQEHILKVLVLLNESREMQRFLKNVSKPYANKYADQVIRDTLGLPSNALVNDPEAKRAVLSAWLCYLRQNVGSCFATAPAIIVHDEQPEQMLIDMIELLGTGRLKRTFGGVEYSVPISSSWGAGDLKRPFILPLGGNVLSSEIWLSPGLIQAFEAVSLIDREDPLKERIEKSKTLILGIIDSWDEKEHYAVTNAGEIIERVLLKDLKINKNDLEDYLNRPRNMLQSNLMMQTAALGGGKGQVCANFFVRQEAAETAFKILADNALLKTWEFTLASFAETKADFSRWNLYSSLGLRPEDEGGIGSALYKILKKFVDEANQKIQEFQTEYELAYQNIKYLEARIRSASEKEAQWIKAEYQSKRNEFDMLEEMRDRYHRRAHRFAHLFDVIMNVYDELFPRYFQEVYDADMHEVASSAYDDSPAGFRLLYKHGRSNTSQWTRIQNPGEYIDALTSFFSNTESEVSSADELAGLDSDVSEIISAIIAQVRSEQFLETSFYRMARAYNTPLIQNPLQNLDKIEKKPWAYTSGGNLGKFISCYYRTGNIPTEVSRWVESPTELLVFFVDTLRQMPPSTVDEFLKDETKSLLMVSPTHAFLLKPGEPLIKQAVESDVFTYTYVRDEFIIPSERFIRHLDLDESMQHNLVQKIALLVAPNFQHYFKQVFSDLAGKKDSSEFKRMIVETMSKERGLRYGRGILYEEQIDSLLFSHLPLFPKEELKSRCEEIFQQLGAITPDINDKISAFWEAALLSIDSENWCNAQQLQNTVKAILCLCFEKTSTPVDYHELVSECAKKLKYAMPMPIVFADTNWVRDKFAFLVGPGSGKLELWRVGAAGLIGTPMTIWEQWLDGSNRERKWGIYTRPYEYRR